MNVSAGRTHHAWPDERFVSVIRAAIGHHPRLEVAVVSSPGDRGRAAAIAAEGGARLVEDAGIRDAFAIVSRADVVFTPDTSIGHACSALGKPAVVLHPQGNSTAWGPYETDGRVVESLTGRVEDIPADEAVRALLRALETVPARDAR